MTSAAPHPPPPASQQQQQQQQQQQRDSALYSQPIPPQLQAAASPGNSKRDLKSWWKGFKLAPKSQEANDSRPQGIFGVPLRQSITYANVAISLIDENGKSYIYGYVPIVVAKCGVFLKEKATEIEGIFRLSGSEKRIKELKTIFDSPDRYGKGLVWDGYTVHDAANVLRRYLNDLPEPVVPLDLYERFREPLRGATKQAGADGEGPQFVENFDMDDAIAKYQQLITELPPLNRQLLLYILDLLAVFAAKSDQNRMNSQNLAAIFQPGMLSHPSHAMAPEEYRLNQSVIIFLIENQDHFLIGMQGTAADEKTVQEVQKGGTPIVKTPTTPGPNRKSGVTRSSSNASAGAESVAKDGQIRRNKSTSSRRSLHSNGAPSPASPAVPSTPSGGLARSNTVPSKKSPALQSGRFGARDSPVGPLTPVNAAMEPSTPRVVEEVATPPEDSQVPPTSKANATAPPRSIAITRSQEKLMDPNLPEVTTPSKERRLPILFQRTVTGESDGRQPNKLRKRKVHSGNPSAHSSTASLPHSTAVSPNVEVTNPIDALQAPPNVDGPAATQPLEAPSEPATKATVHPPQPPTSNSLHPQSAEANLRSKKSPPTSLHSSFNEGSDLDQVEEPQPAGVDSGQQDSSAEKEREKEKERKKRWRLSRKKEEAPPSSHPPLSPPRPPYGSNAHAEASSSSIGSGGKLRHSMTGETSDSYVANFDGQGPGPEGQNKEGKEDTKGLTGWIKHKYRETVEQRRNKSPPGDRTSSLGASFLHGRGKSIDLKRAPQQPEEKPPAVPQQMQQTQQSQQPLQALPQEPQPGTAQ
ncbi:hypothetical protein QBC34DRAFT_388647 [Podospora aff. communis PSN243]|uniref:Rho-GAP domain-containing protein n=1 Tax=Podospora aff. communis PSN243 TaxID=3040156 RepID=A0AAV9H5Q1_9PEZI|nr:hypothetical protein QBC34DRAFT_388647 [Podospora aff. communis PSN243]